MTIQELENKIVEAAQYYYEGTPIMSDKEWDDLVEYLKASNPSSSVLSTVGWGYNPYKLLGEKQNHLYGKILGIERKPRTIEDIPNSFLNNEVCLSAKLDGLSIVIYFVNGQVTKALTRGNGITGINRTDKLKAILEKELILPSNFDFTGAIRGEICISNDNWKVMESLGINGSNQRNTATGIINRDDILEDIKYLDVIFYKVVGYNNNDSTFNSIYSNNVLGANKFDVKFLRKFIKPEYIVEHRIDEQFNASQNDLETLFEQFNIKYPCDGIVITQSIRYTLNVNDNKYLNNVNIQNEEVAYKFVTESAITEVEDIRWKMSKGNRIKPVINVKTVELSGANVSNATAYNAKYVYDNDLGIGSKVELIRSGEVIPYITKVLSGSNGVARQQLDEMICPFCGSKLVWEGVDLICNNPDCLNRDISNLKIWVANIGQVDGISEKLIFKFFEELNINSLDDLYSKSYEELEFKDVPSNSHKGKFNLVLKKLFKEEINIENLLIGLNIKMLGIKNAQKLTRNNDFIDWFKNEFIKNINNEHLDYETLNIERLRNICRNIIGEAFSEIISSIDSISKMKNITYVFDRIIYNDVNVQTNLIPVVITGKLSIPRKKFEEYLLNNGYEVKGNITKDTKYLIIDNPNSSSSKNKKANELGIEKISEMDIRHIIDNTNH